ncbi:glyceraldehyde 3-phosphate dehydrogenase (NAD(P)+) [Halomicrobium zhouii]|uniref:Glyceraldehyde-3-phosphate dehydrogenase n=1 Tax=Halomicrobium zhouii TaxID=767519 RepID=A0A1I6KZ04_9EURY|nr:type II glyceraldehyde-3-phosphate dehydrogenase [Halomicrobium zhouii]SFR96452.1 glyceraldehyde 3-phosphate dehydrogenase (NAD(P)+) [Halomicrobium zhouii]
MLRVGINGFGTIGKRVADAVRAQPDMRVAGVAKRSPNYEAEVALDRGYALYSAADDGATPFEDAGLPVEGGVHDLVVESDIVVDATPSGVGAQNKGIYEAHDTPAIFQGGEDADVAEVSFNARANYDDAIGADFVRVVSCNTTGLSRLLAPLKENYGVENVRVTLVRRGGDPSDTGRGPINDTLPDPIAIPSHHGPDVQTVFPDVRITTMGLKVPSTLMHTHSLNVTLESEPDVDEVRDLFADESRLFLLPERLGIDGAGKLKEYTSDAGRPRGDVWENCIWDESLTMDGADLYLFQAIHQEADVVPENVDAVRAIADAATKEESVERTNEALGVGSGLTDHAVDHADPISDAASDD